MSWGDLATEQIADGRVKKSPSCRILGPFDQHSEFHYGTLVFLEDWERLVK